MDDNVEILLSYDSYFILQHRNKSIKRKAHSNRVSLFKIQRKNC